MGAWHDTHKRANKKGTSVRTKATRQQGKMKEKNDSAAELFERLNSRGKPKPAREGAAVNVT